MSEIRIAIRRAPGAQDLPLPAYATSGSAGMDLHAALDAPLVLQPGARALVPTGISIALPPGCEAQVRPRSGLALQHGLGMVNAPGTIDSDYRGMIGVVLINWGTEPVELKRGDRVAQLVVAPVMRVEWIDSGDNVLPETQRGTGGFGHTGFGHAAPDQGAETDAA